MDPVRVREFERLCLRYEKFAQQSLAPRVHPDREPLDVAAWQFPANTDPIDDPRDVPADHPVRQRPPSFDEAVGQHFGPVQLGWQWGPAWSTCWFRLTGRVPERFAGCSVVLRFSSMTEALVWRRGTRGAGLVVQGLDDNRDRVPLQGLAEPGARIELFVEAACNHPFGAHPLEFDDPERQARWSTPTPGRLIRCELATFDQRAWDLLTSYEFARLLLREVDPLSPEAELIRRKLERVTRALPDDPNSPIERAAVDGAIASLSFEDVATPYASVCHAVGHAHIDNAWLWPVRETRRKCLRSFSNVLGLMEREEAFRFMCSQAQQYAYVEQDAPELFERLSKRVHEGRWEPVGGMWVEPDCSCPSGESLIRQALHADRYWRRRFGDKAAQRLLYLPDTFGFPGTLPGIMRACGLDTFITNKMCWNQLNEMPHATFEWEGVDGTRVLAHLTPGGDYNAVNTPRELRRGAARASHTPNAKDLDTPRTTTPWLQPFGFGDGGGGPTDTSIRYARLGRGFAGLPHVQLSSAREFIEALHRERERTDLPCWRGEIYLEFHRGTYTTQAQIKRANRELEDALAEAELLSTLAPGGAGKSPMEREWRERKLDEAWKLLLVNQFHDVLPGSSIPWAYDEAREDYARARGLARKVAQRGLDAWLDAVGIADAVEPALVVNTSGRDRAGVAEVEHEDGSTTLKFVRTVPAMGARAIDLASSSACVPVVCDPDSRRLSNGVIEAVLDSSGHVISLRRAGSPHEIAAAPLNQLLLYRDRPHRWDAWDIDPEYVANVEWSSVGSKRRVKWRVGVQHPLRAELVIERRIGEASTIEQTFRLDAGSPRLEIRSRVDWREDHRLLRAIFPVTPRSDTFTCGTQFGHVMRPTHRNTSWQRAMFEVCAHHWIDLSQPGLGCALLTDHLYGFSCDGSTMGVSLLRSPTHPDPRADRGDHEFAYAIMPHEGDWRAAGVVGEGESMHRPLRGRAMKVAGRAVAAERDLFAPVRFIADEGFGPGRVAIDAIKRGEDDESIIVRVHECHGARARASMSFGFGVERIAVVDAMERPTTSSVLSFGPAGPELTLDPLRIVTLAITPT